MQKSMANTLRTTVPRSSRAAVSRRCSSVKVYATSRVDKCSKDDVIVRI